MSKHRKPKAASIPRYVGLPLITGDRFERTGGQGYRMSGQHMCGGKGPYVDAGHRGSMSGGLYIFPELEGYSHRKGSKPGWAWKP